MSADLTTNISGPNGLVEADAANLNTTDAWLEVEDVNGNSVKVNGALLKFILGSLTFTGDITGSGNLGALALSIAAGHVTLAMLANLPATSVIGSGPGGTPHALTLAPSDFAVVSDVVHLQAGQNADDAESSVIYARYGSL